MTSEPSNSYPKLVVRGNATNAFQQTVESLHSSASDLYQFRLGLLSDDITKRYKEPGFSWDSVWEIHKQATPLAALESEVFAAKFGLHPGQWLAYSGLSDWMDYNYVFQPSDLGCSTVLLPSELSPEVSALQTWDLHAFVEQHSLILERHFEEYCSALTLTTSMGHAHFGLNEAGVFVGTNNLACKYPKMGVTFAAAIMHVLHHAQHANEGATILSQLPLMSGHNYIVCDSLGTVLNVEQATTGVVVTEVNQEHFVHTNHYIASKLKESGWDYSPSSPHRYNVLQNYGEYASFMDGAPLQSAKVLFSDHTAALCRHPENEKDTATCALLGFLPRESKLAVLKGRPCEGEWTFYALESD